jgi:hypothetical protein
MKFTNLFDGPFHDSLSERGKEEVDKEHTEWLKEIGIMFLFGIIFGFMIAITLL